MFRYMMLCLLVMTTALACDDSSSNPGSGYDVFPTSVGSTWSYRWHDRILDVTDTVVVSLIGTREIPTWGEASVLVEEHPSRVDTVFMVVQGNKVRFIPGSNRTSTSGTYLLPLWLGSTWSISPLDTSRVVDLAELEVPAGRFDFAYDVERRAFGFNYGLHAETWVVAGVGIVKEDLVEYNLGPWANYERELIGYSIPNDPAQ